MNCIETVVLATRNSRKVDQIRHTMQSLPIRLMTLTEARIKGEAPEDGVDGVENARQKAHYAWERKKTWTLADDASLFIHALDGRPGHRAARWAGDGATTEQIMEHALRRMQDIPTERRTATFRSDAILLDPCGNEHHFAGEVHGRILSAPRVPCEPGMPYSAIFVPDGQPKAFSEMTAEEKEQYSHRAIAFREVRDHFDWVLCGARRTLA